MAILTIPQIYAKWIGAGGHTGDLAVYMTAIALAESDGNTLAVSPSQDYGVWQINISHAREFPNLWPHRFDPHANALMAKAISGNGIDIGPWCTVWTDPGTYCGSYKAPPPQAGSPAGKLVAHVAAVVGSARVPPLTEVIANDASQHGPGSGAWSQIQHLFGAGGANWERDMNAARNYIKGVGR